MNRARRKTKYRSRGVTPLQGGFLENIGPGGAKKVHGNYHHDKGGGPVTPDGTAEFEKDEIIAQANLKNGGLTDYVFSEYLNMDGSKGYNDGKTSIANVAEEMAMGGAPQGQFDQLAIIQEEHAGRSGNKIAVNGMAKHGGRLSPVPYQTTGSMDENTPQTNVLGTVPENMQQLMDEDYIEGDLTYNVLNKGVSLGEGSKYPQTGTEEFTSMFNKYTEQHRYYIDQPGHNAWMQYYGSDDYWTFEDLKLKLDLDLAKTDIKFGNKSALIEANVETYDEFVAFKTNELNEKRNTFLNSDGDKSSTLNTEFEQNSATRYLATKVPLSEVEVGSLRNERLSEAAYKFNNEWDIEQQVHYVMSTDEKYLTPLQMGFKNSWEGKMWQELKPLWEQFQSTRSEFVTDLNSLGPYGASKKEVADLEEMVGKGPRWLLENQGAAEIISELGHLLGFAEGSALDRDWKDSHVKQMTYEEWALMGFPEHYGNIFEHVMKDAINDRYMELDMPAPENTPTTQLAGIGNIFKLFGKTKGAKNTGFIASLMRGMRNRGGSMFTRNSKGNVAYKRTGNIGFNSGKTSGGKTGGKGGSGTGANKPSGFFNKALDKFWNTKEVGVNVATSKRLFNWYATTYAVQMGYNELYPMLTGDTGYTNDPADMQDMKGYDETNIYGPDAVNVYDLGIGNPESIDSLRIDELIKKNTSGQYDYIEGYKQGGAMNSRNNFVDTFQMYRKGGPLKYQTRGFQFQPYISPAGKTDSSGKLINNNPFYPGYKMGTRQADLEMEKYRSRGIMKKPRIKYRRGAPIPYQTIGTNDNVDNKNIEQQYNNNLLQPNFQPNNEMGSGFNQGSLSREGNIDFMSMFNRPPAGPVASGGEESMFSGVKSQNEQKRYNDYIASEGPDPYAQTYDISNMGLQGFRGVPPTPTQSQVIDKPLTSGFTPIETNTDSATGLKMGGKLNYGYGGKMQYGQGGRMMQYGYGGPKMYQDSGSLPTTNVASDVFYGGTDEEFETIPDTQPTIGKQSYQGMDDLVLYGDDFMQEQFNTNLGGTLDQWRDQVDSDIMADLGYMGDDWATGMFSDPIKNKKGKVIGYQGVMDYQNAWNAKNSGNKDKQIRTDGKFGEQTFRTAIGNKPIELDTIPAQPLPVPPTEINIKRPEPTPPEVPKEPAEGCPCEDGTTKPECCEEPTEEGSSIEFHSPKNLRWLIPTIGGLSQLIAPLKAQKLEADQITAPIMGREKLERVDFNAQLASGNAETRAMNKFLETSGGGPGIVANKMAAFAANRDSQMKIKSEEATQNAQISNAEASINANISSENAKNVLAANKYNADARMDVKKTKLAAWDAMGNRIAGMAGDTMAYLAERDKARAIAGDPAILDRNRFFGNVRNQHLLDENGAPTEDGQKAYQEWLKQQRNKNRFFHNTTVMDNTTEA